MNIYLLFSQYGLAVTTLAIFTQSLWENLSRLNMLSTNAVGVRAEYDVTSVNDSCLSILFPALHGNTSAVSYFLTSNAGNSI